MYKPTGGLYSEGRFHDFTEGHEFGGGLWGLYMDGFIFGILRYVNLHTI